MRADEFPWRMTAHAPSKGRKIQKTSRNYRTPSTCARCRSSSTAEAMSIINLPANDWASCCKNIASGSVTKVLGYQFAGDPLPLTQNHKVAFAAAQKAAKHTVQESVWSVTIHTCSKCWGFFFNSDGKVSVWLKKKKIIKKLKDVFKAIQNKPKAQIVIKGTMTRQGTQPTNPCESTTTKSLNDWMND